MLFHVCNLSRLRVTGLKPGCTRSDSLWLGLLPFMLRGQNTGKCLWKCCTSSTWIPAMAPREAQQHLLITGLFQRHFFTGRTKKSAASWAECEWHTQLKTLLPFGLYLFSQHTGYICGVCFLWFVFFFSAVFSYQALSFPLYQENVAAFTPEEPAGWQASETEGQS